VEPEPTRDSAGVVMSPESQICFERRYLRLIFLATLAAFSAAVFFASAVRSGFFTGPLRIKPGRVAGSGVLFYSSSETSKERLSLDLSAL
jgi:hypothetical protein